MQHRDMLLFLITLVIENEGSGKSHFSASVSKDAMEGIFRGYFWLSLKHSTGKPAIKQAVLILQKYQGQG